MNKFAIFLLASLLTPWNTSQIPGVLSFKSNYSQGLVGSYESHRCLEKTLHTEAIGEPVEGIIAVLHVVQNRLKHKDYPETYCKVVLQPKQFSWFNKLNSKYNNQIPLEQIKTPLEGSLTEKELIIQLISYQATIENLSASEIVAKPSSFISSIIPSLICLTNDGPLEIKPV